MTDTTSFRYFFYHLSVLTVFIQSLVISNAVKGLTLPFCFFSLQLFLDFFLLSPPFVQMVKRISVIFGLFLLWSLLVQYANSTMYISFDNMVLISDEGADRTVWRKSFFTQSLYFFFVWSVALYTFFYLKSTGAFDRLLKLLTWGAVLVASIGIVEFLYFMFTGNVLNLVPNRITGDENVFNLFQTMQIFGLNIMRIKSLSGEPSMYVFSILPVAVILYYRNLKSYLFLLLPSLLFCFSTSFYLGIVIFLVLDLLFLRKTYRIQLLLLLLFIFGGVYYYDYLMIFFDDTLLKIKLENTSGFSRFQLANYTFQFWKESDLFHQLFGYGFGYVRSTDGLTSFLVNIGLLGTVFFCWPIVILFRKFKQVQGGNQGFIIAMGICLILFLVSVPEFAFPHSWIIGGMTFYLFEVGEGKLFVKNVHYEQCRFSGVK